MGGDGRRGGEEGGTETRGKERDSGWKETVLRWSSKATEET